nr:YdaS family helix-turn-helix protein [Snodgrassella alvi]
MNKYILMAVNKAGGQTALAEKLGVSKSAVNAWCKGRNGIRPDQAKKIEQVTGISAVSLVFTERN